MVIFTLIILQAVGLTLGQRTYHCDYKNEYARYFDCLSKWRLVRESSRGHSTFLKDVGLIDEICILPGNPRVEEMDKCVRKMVTPFCDSILAHWSGTEQFVRYLCKFREDFEGRFARCRKNRGFQSAYENCMSTNVKEISTGEDNCSSYRKLQRCLKEALGRHCSHKAAAFFNLAFVARDNPLIAYSCKHVKSAFPEYVIDIQSDGHSPVKPRQPETSDNQVNTVEPSGNYKGDKNEGNNLKVGETSGSQAGFSSLLTTHVLLLNIILKLMDRVI